MAFVQKIELGDPSTNIQDFVDVKLKVLCCRYWSLDLWDCHDMIFPFWRIYWNKNEGGELYYNDEVFKMNPDHLYIIAPFTSFSSRLEGKHMYNSGIHVLGKHISNADNESDYENTSLIHFFTHFNLGVPFDNVFPGIFKIELSAFLNNRLRYLTSKLKIENKAFKLTFNLKLQSFIKESLSNIAPKLWKTINIDERVLTVLRYIEANIDQKLSNAELASVVHLAPNSFARLFKEEMDLTLHFFIQKRKIARACDFFEHSHMTIEEVAFKLGFSDRFHFSRVFKSITGLSPARYKSRRLS